METTVTKMFLHLDPGKQQRILESALNEFANKGYAAASMNTVVEEAKISKGALFKYFGSKSGLFGFIYRLALNQVKDYLRRVRDSSQDQNFFERLNKIMVAGVDFIDRYPLLARIYFRLIYTGDSPYKNEILQELHRESLKFIQSMVKQGIERGELRKDISAQTTAFVLECVIDRFLQAHRLEFLDPSLKLYQASLRESERWVDEILGLLRMGMATPPSP